MKCSRCHLDNPDSADFCAKCGTKLAASDEVLPSFTRTLKTPIRRLEVGSIFAERYEVLGELGKGGMGEVYRVKDQKLDEEMALKVLKPEIAAHKEIIERFKNELKFARRIAHRNVCKMYDLDEEEDILYITMEYVKGKDLKSFIGGEHEFKGGVEFETISGDYDAWRKDNMNWLLDSRYPPKNYAYGTYGRVGFASIGQESGSTRILNRGGRIGAYIQDSVTFAKRLTLNIGIRFDQSRAWQPATEKEQAAPFSYWLGENVVKPHVAATYPSNFPNGLNPWAAMTSPEWKNIITWNEFSPRFGLTYDPFGDGETAVKFSFNRSTEYLMVQYFAQLHPFVTRGFAFNWYDDNNTNYPDIGDTFIIRPADFRVMDPEFGKKQVDPKTRSPIADELTLGVWRELFRDFSLGLSFIYKEKKNIVEAVYYAPDTGESWYHPDQDAAKKYWVPFTTTIPGTDTYPTQTVTLYIRRNDSPAPFTRWTNVPELKRKYWAAELIFNKRMSGGWQVGGSVLYCKAHGNIGGLFDDSTGWAGLGSTPNHYVNSYGRINTDRPLQIKLFGTVTLPYRIFLSAFYAYLDGAPWTRNVSIRPPTAWTTATNTYRDFYAVNIEQQGSRRHRAWNQLDVRLEKEFSLGRIGRLGAYIDVENLLGYSSVDVGLDDVYRWEPAAEGANQPGTKTLETSYKVVSSITGTREVKASLRFSF